MGTLPARGAGRDLISGPNVMKGYYKQPEATRRRCGAAGSTPATSVTATRTVSSHRRSHEGHDPPRRIQRVSARDRGGALRAPRGRRGRGDRRPEPAQGEEVKAVALRPGAATEQVPSRTAKRADGDLQVPARARTSWTIYRRVRLASCSRPSCGTDPPPIRSTRTCRRSRPSGDRSTPPTSAHHMHEHVFVLTADVQQNYPDEWGTRTSGSPTRSPSCGRSPAQGVRTIVDPTVVGLGRYIPRIQRIAEQVPTSTSSWPPGLHLRRRPVLLPLPRSGAGRSSAAEVPDPMVDLFVERHQRRDRRHRRPGRPAQVRHRPPGPDARASSG